LQLVKDLRQGLELAVRDMETTGLELKKLADYVTAELKN
jgi:hypothetical protein